MQSVSNIDKNSDCPEALDMSSLPGFGVVRSLSGLPGAWRCTGRNNEEMVDKFVQTGVITTKEVEDAFRAVPRGAFVPHDLQLEAYVDSPLRGEPHVHLSAPHMYATVMEALKLSPGMSFLNIGSGTGYFSCIAGYILQNQGINHGIELHEDLVQFARGRVEEYLQFCPAVAHDICQPKFLAGNCFRLDPSGCSYDRVYCGAACPISKVPFIVALTKIGGFAVIPCRNRLLKIERISASGVKQTCISDVCFASLTSLPESESSLPKLCFPKEIPKRKEKIVKVYPPANLVVSRGQARTLMARLRALQEASECLHTFQPVPVAFCYVPSRHQMQQYLLKKPKTNGQSSTVIASPVDRKICFFGPQDPCEARRPCNSSGRISTDQSVWRYLQEDKLWLTVLEYYYSLCNVSPEKRSQAMNVYIRKRVKHKSERKESKKYLSYAELAHKLGILTVKTHKHDSKQSSGNPKDSSKSDFEVQSCSVRTLSIDSVSSETDHNSEKRDSNNSNGFPVCDLLRDATVSGNSNDPKTICSQTDMKLPNSSTSCQKPDGSLQTSSSEEDIACHGNFSKDCGTTLTSPCEKYANVLVTMDTELMERLSASPSSNWSLSDDLVLVRFLCEICEKSSQGRSKGWFNAEYALNELFSKTSIMNHSCLSSYSFESLAYRCIVLCRIAQVLDSALHLVSGPSVLAEQNFCPNKYGLESFTESSFVSSWQSWDAGSSPGPLFKPINEEATSSFVLKNAGDDLLMENTKQIHGKAHGKRTKASLLSLENLQEKLKAVKKKISFIEEQKQMLHNIQEQTGVIHGESELELDAVDVNLQRSELLLKQQKQENYRSLVLALLKKLKEEERLLSKKVESATEVLKRNTGDSSITKCSSEERKSIPEPTLLSHKLSTSPVNTQESDGSPVRFSLASLLPKIRFLLPLCSQRWRLVHELLHATELSAPEYMPVITVDRRVPLIERHANTGSSVFLQVNHELKKEKLHFRWNKWKYDQWWEVKFVGEGIIDQGGGFRDSLAEISDELCPVDDSIPDILPYFIKTPNHKEGAGDFVDCFIPNPGCNDLRVYRWIGVLIGGVFRSDESLTLSFPPFVWKLLVGEHVTWAKDFVAIDEATVHMIDELEVQDEESYESNYGNECTFSTVLSDGRCVALLSEGEGRVVKPGERQEYAALVRRSRMTEFTKQVQAMKEGLMTVVPESVLALLTWGNLERGVCGDRDISLAHLKGACKYGDDWTDSCDSVKHLWTVLSQFSSTERSRFLRFVTGRKRPPAPFTVAKAGGDKDGLPHASTCASTLFLPEYSSAAVAKEKLSYAISNCVAIDTDTSPW